MSSTTIFLLSLAWFIGAVSAYPRHKKWVRESDSVWNSSRGKLWTNERMLLSMLSCLLFWPIVWMWFVGEMIGKFVDYVTTSNVAGRLEKWGDRRATFDENLSEMFKRMFGSKKDS